MFTAKKLAQIELSKLRAELGYCGADRMRRIRLELRIAEVEKKIAKSDSGELIW